MEGSYYTYVYKCKIKLQDFREAKSWETEDKMVKVEQAELSNPDQRK